MGYGLRQPGLTQLRYFCGGLWRTRCLLWNLQSLHICRGAGWVPKSWDVSGFPSLYQALGENQCYLHVAWKNSKRDLQRCFTSTNIIWMVSYFGSGSFLYDSFWEQISTRVYSSFLLWVGLLAASPRNCRYPQFQRIIIFHIFDGLLINFGGWGYPFSDTATSTVPKSSSSLAQVCSEELALEAEVERTLQCLAVATTPKKKGG